ncbi:MAG: lysophospholipid acyltransferase family protein [Zoogloeaceae bacterium]|jgi:KDO2-lipid IV(A) lauroyltransferase|nr:lysophospholipid acyltransferase family protein [Zoogloeaceae bacterium]
MFFLFRLLSRLPLHALHNLGAALGWLTWLASPTYRRRMRENLALAGLPRARNAAIAEAGKGLAELPKIWLRPKEEILALVARASGWEHVEAARAAGKGILYLTPHLGCFEITAQYLAARPDAQGATQPITVLWRRPRQDWLAPLMEAGRAANLKLAPADLSGVRRLMKALRQGEASGMLPDQVPGKGEGVWVPFFGKPAYTMTLAARLAEGGAAVLLTYAERLAYGAGYHVRFIPLSQPLVGGLNERAAIINREIEALIRLCPEQYLWGYNRYKRPSGAPEPPVSP